MANEALKNKLAQEENLDNKAKVESIEAIKNLNIQKPKMNNPNNSLATFDPNNLSAYAGMGMASVDPRDVPPPRIMLVHDAVYTTPILDQFGKRVEPGNFVFSGMNNVMPAFNAYICVAKPVEYMDKSTNEAKVRYDAIGIMADETLAPFIISFKNSSAKALTPVFQYASANKLPLWVLEIRFVAVKKTFDSGRSSFVVNATVVGRATDTTTLNLLFNTCRKYEKTIDSVHDNQAAVEYPAQQEKKIEDLSEIVLEDDMPF